MDCDADERDSGDASSSDDDGEGVAGSKRKKSKKGSTRAGSSSPASKNAKQSPSCSATHTLAAISTIKGWQGDFQQNCGVCGSKCGWYCVECSAAQLPHACKPIHPGVVRDKKYECLAVHKKDPSATSWRSPRAASGKPGRKRNRDDG